MNPITNYRKVLKGISEMIRRYYYSTCTKTEAGQLALYRHIGTILLKARFADGWNCATMVKLSADIGSAFPGQRNFYERNLRSMRAFARRFPMFYDDCPAGASPLLKAACAALRELLPPGDHEAERALCEGLIFKLTWYHHRLLVNHFAKAPEYLFYMQRAASNGWSARLMHQHIRNGLYARQQDEAIHNFAATLPAAGAALAGDTFRKQYVFDFLGMEAMPAEQELERGLIRHLKQFMQSLGSGFTYIGNQYGMPAGDYYCYLDLLLYNLALRCYVVIELKVDDFVPEYMGKLNFYVNKVDATLKGKNDNPTIGILLCKNADPDLVAHSLAGLKAPMCVAQYNLVLLPGEKAA